MTVNIRDKKIKTQNKNKHQIILEIQKQVKHKQLHNLGHGPKENMEEAPK